MADPVHLFIDSGLPPSLIDDIRRFNPWWEGEPMPVQPKTRRHLVQQMRRRLDANLAPVAVVRGPRQIGKTTAQFQLIQDLLNEGVSPRRILRVQFDEIDSLKNVKEPILRISEWFERNIAPMRFNALAHRDETAYLFFDEIQNLDKWDAQLKSLVDNSTVKAIVTGSSALRIALGRDSLAGRITTVEAGALSLTEVGALRGMSTPKPFLKDNGLKPLTEKGFWEGLREYGAEHKEFRKSAFQSFSERGAYPLGHKNKDTEWPHVADQLNETIIKRVIQHDLRVGDRGRKRDPALLEELFRIACRYAGQAPSIATMAEEVRKSLDANIGSERVRQYLSFLGDTLLLRLIPPLEIRLKKKRGNHKLCLIDHGLRASWLQEQAPLTPEELSRQSNLTTLAGHIAESVTGSTASTIHGLDISHMPERKTDREVDFILTVGSTRIPVEVKYQKRIDHSRDLLGLRSFMDKTVNNSKFGLLITQDSSIQSDDSRIIPMPLSTFMMLR